MMLLMRPQASLSAEYSADGLVIRYGNVGYATGTRFGHPSPIEGMQPAEGPWALTITAPADLAPGADCPVVVIVHGGGYVNGSRDEECFNGEALAREQMVVVSVDYRLGLAGFAQFHDEPASYYRGVMDCQAALEWLQVHVEEFGGDPTNVTLVGQSAGAGIVAWLCRKDHYQGLFRRAWAMSPTFPRVPFTRRKRLLRLLLGKPITRLSFEQTLPRRLARAERRMQALVRTDLPFGPAPMHASELAEVPMVLTCTLQELYLASQADLDRSPLRPWLKPPIRRLLQAKRGYQPDAHPKHGIAAMLGDAMILSWVDHLAAYAPAPSWVIVYAGTEDTPAVHCCDIPLTLGSAQSIPPNAREYLQHPDPALVHDCFERFVAYARGETPQWPAYQPRREALSVPIDGSGPGLVCDPLAAARQGFPK